MYKLSEWAKKITSHKNTYSRLQWLMNGKESHYVDIPFIRAAKSALEQEHKAMIAFLNSEIEKRK